MTAMTSSEQPLSDMPEPTAPRTPDLAGTFAVYLLEDGGAMLTLLGVSDEPQTHRLPAFIVDLVLHGKKPSMKTIMTMMSGGK